MARARTPRASPQTQPLQVFRHPSFKTVSARLEFIRGINGSIATHVSYQDSSMDPVREELRAREAELSTAHLAVEAGNRTFAPQRDAAMYKMDEALYDFVHLAEKKGRADPAALYNIGLDSLMITPSKKSVVVAPVSAPSNLGVVNGAHMGQMLASVGTMPGVRSWELWMTEDPNDESSWRYYQTFFKSSEMLISGLESGKVYFFRIRGLNSAGASPWSIVVSLRAL
jgi:hypothetical protein